MKRGDLAARIVGYLICLPMCEKIEKLSVTIGILLQNVVKIAPLNGVAAFLCYAGLFDATKGITVTQKTPSTLVSMLKTAAITSKMYDIFF